jgi:hypothetical protein
MVNLLTVFGATGIQGGSVIRAVLADSALSQSFKIRAVTRDASKPSAQALSNQGIEVITVSRFATYTMLPCRDNADTPFLGRPEFAVLPCQGA